MDRLYDIYFDLLGKEIEYSNKLLATKNAEKKIAFIDKTLRYSREASVVAKAIKEIEDHEE